MKAKISWHNYPISDKVDVNLYINKGNNSSEDITTVNLYIVNVGAPGFHKTNANKHERSFRSRYNDGE